MSELVQITIPGRQQAIKVPKGTVIYDLVMQRLDVFPKHPKGLQPVAAKINNQIVAFSDSIQYDCIMELIYTDSANGQDIFRRSLVFILFMAWRRVFPSVRLEISHSIGHAYYFTIKTADVAVSQVLEISETAREKLTEDHCQPLRQEMNKIISQDIPIISRKAMNNQQAIEIFEAQKDNFTTALLQSRNETRIIVQQCEDYYQLAHTPLVATTGQLKCFDLCLESKMLVLVFPSQADPEKVPQFKHNAPLSHLFEEYGAWAQAMNIESIGQLNAIVRQERFKSYVQICESRQNQMYSQVAELILRGHKSANGPMAITEALKNANAQQKTSLLVGGSSDEAQTDQIKLVAISGPSSSSKTSSTWKLSSTLTVMGRKPIVLSMDNYYKDSDKTPIGEDGKHDFEHVEALDIEYFNLQLSQLLNGQQIQSPIFDFKIGKRSDKTIPMILPSRGIVLIEGIHALNPIMTKSVPAANKFCIFIQPLPCINLDDRTRLSTRDYRLIRRIVRDNRTRGCSAARTIELFHNVRKGEDAWIFPHTSRADVYINTALDYELLVLSTFVTPLLHEIAPDSESYSEARRLLSFLEWMPGANADLVPKHSVLREFIGGSAFPVD